MPPWPIAMPSSTAIVLNSRGIAPAARTASATTWPTSRRCTCPGTNSVKLLATAMIGLPKSSLATPVARSSARAPAMFRPCVTSAAASPNSPHKQLMGSSAYRGISPRRRANVRQHPRCRVVDRSNFLAGEPGHAVLHPAAPLEVLAQRRPGEHVDIPDRGDVPRDLRPVDGERGPDHDLGAERTGQDLAGLCRLPHRVLEPVLLRLGAVVQLLAVPRPDRELRIPLLRVDRVDPGRPHDQVVDELAAVR